MKPLKLLLLFQIIICPIIAQVQTYLTWETPITNYAQINTNQGIERTAGGFGYDKGQVNSVQSIATGESFTFQILLSGHQNFCALIPSKPTGQILYDNNSDGTWVGSNAAIRTGLIIGVNGDNTARPLSLGAEVGPDEAIVNYQWFRFNYSGTTIQIQKSTDGVTFTTFHTITGASGSYFFFYQAIVQGSKLESVYKTSASGGNQAPTVAAGIDISITLPVNTATLTASASDADGSISTYAWSKVAGPSGGGINTPGTASTGITGLIAGTYTYRITVTDNIGATASDDVNIIVSSAGNTSVSAGPDQSLAVGTTTTTLSGTGVSSSSTDLIIFFGESNASGQAPNSAATAIERLARPSVKILNNFNGLIEDLDLDQNNAIDVCGQPTTHGMEIGLADAVEAGRFNNPVYLLKVACAGTRIDQWLSGSGNPSLTEAYRKVDLMKAQMAARGISNPNIVVWMSIGLNDALFGTNVDSFSARIGRFTSQFRTRYGATVQFHMTQFHRYRPDFGETAPTGNGHPYCATIDAINAGDPLLYTVETTDAGWITGEEAVHWSYTGFKVIANRMTTSTINNKVGGSVTWSKLSGPSGGAITSPNQLVTGVTGLLTGTYVYRLSVGAITDDVNVFVGQSSSTINTSIIPITDPEIMRHLGGAEDWFDVNKVDIPSTANKQVPRSSYRRFNWFELETSSGVYNWALFDQMFIDAINRGQTVSWGVMTVNENIGSGRPFVGSAWLNYPTYLHTLMQAETINNRDWTYTSGSESFWIPNWNSTNFLTRTKALYDALYNRMNTQSYNGILFKNIVDVVEVRHYGQWGEWHAVNYASQPSDYPTGRQPTVPTLDSIISYIVRGNPDLKTTIIISAFDGYRLANVWNDPAVAKFALTIKNNAGFVGWRKDHIGDAIGSPYDFDWTSGNATGYSAPTAANQQSGAPSFVAFGIDTATMNRWKLAPITAEPPGYRTEDARGDMANLPAEVRYWHHVSFGNGNFGPAGWNPFQPDSVRLASKIAGHRLQIEGGTMTQSLISGSAFTVSLNWKNTGLTPSYDAYNVMFYLKNVSGVTVWSDTSSFRPYLFLPATTATVVNDGFTLTSIPAGQYSLYVRMEDPKQGYRIPYPLAIQGRLADGSYLLRSGISVTTGGSNIPPTVAINPINQSNSITLPTNSITLVSSSTDPDGTISSRAWSKTLGGAATIVSPTAITTVINGLVEGTYTFQISVTDNGGAVTLASIGITVLPSTPNPVSPTANAGADSVVILPASTVTLIGSGTDPDGTISTYAWSKISGPSGAGIVNPNQATTRVENLVSGNYIFRLTVADNTGSIGTDDVLVTVTGTIALDAGKNRTIYVNKTTLVAKIPTNATAQVWSKLSGPVSGWISTPSLSKTEVTGLVTGVYVFRVTATVNGLPVTDDVTITVSNSRNRRVRSINIQ